MKATVHVFLKPGVLDVQGKAVEQALHGLGWGGVSLTAQATGLARNTITQGVRELQERQTHAQSSVTQRVRRVGAGRAAGASVLNAHAPLPASAPG